MHFQKYLFIVLFSFCFLNHSFAQFSNDNWTGADKTKHMYVGATISSSSYLIVRGAGVPPKASLFLSIAAGTGAGLMKEFMDYDKNFGGSGFSGKDLTVTIAGSVTGSISSFLIDRYILHPKNRRKSTRRNFSRIRRRDKKYHYAQNK